MIATTTPSVQDRACPSENPAELRSGTNLAQLVVGHHELDVCAFDVSRVLDPGHLEAVVGGRFAVSRFELEKVGAGAADGRAGRTRWRVAPVNDDGFEDAEPLSRL